MSAEHVEATGDAIATHATEAGHAVAHAVEAGHGAAHGAGEAASKTELFQEALTHVLDSSEWHPFGMHVHLPHWMSLHTLMLFICAGLLIFLFGFVYRRKEVVPTGFTNLLESMVVFVRDEISIANLGEEDGRKFAPFFCSMFFFILGLNLLGAIPVFATATGNVSVTAGFGVITLLTVIGVGLYHHGVIGYLKSFAPSGVPLPVLVLLYPLEIFGVFIKAFALTLRLFANMLAGHLVLISILGMTILFGLGVAIPAVALAVCIYLLELFVAFLQAYIFCLLSAMFVGASLHSEH